MDSSTQFHYLEIIRAGGYNTARDFGTLSQRYFTFSECMNNKALAVGEAQHRDPSIIGGICHADDDQRMYVLELFGML